MNLPFIDKLTHYLRSGHIMLSCTTPEQDRCLFEIRKCAHNCNRKLFVWSIATGWLDEEGNKVGSNQPEADTGLVEITTEIPQEPAVLVMRNFDFYIHNQTNPRFDIVLSWLEQLKHPLYINTQSIIFLGPEFKTPIHLQHDITNIDFNLPNEEEIGNIIDNIFKNVVDEKTKKPIQVDNRLRSEAIRACTGMVKSEVADRVALALRVCKNLNKEAIKLILNEKANIINTSGILRYMEAPAHGMETVGGLDNLREYIKLDKPCFTKAAQDFGVDPPKGILLCGVPGTGKSLSSIAIGGELSLPIIFLDIGSLMGSLVGESESNLRHAIKLIEAISPCVVILEEIEKALGGTGDLDGGTSKRILGNILSWMQDRTVPVYICATANNVHSLPPEILRSGRFDAMFFVDLPSYTERKNIAKIHLSKRKQNPELFDLDLLAKSTDMFSGADIEQVIKLAMKMAFAQQTQLTDAHLVKASKEIVPLSKIEPEKIENIRGWGKAHCKPANKPEPQTVKQMPSRKVEA